MKKLLLLFSSLFFIGCGLSDVEIVNNVFVDSHRNVVIQCLNCHTPDFLIVNSEKVMAGFIDNHIQIGVECLLCHNDVILWGNEHKS